MADVPENLKDIIDEAIQQTLSPIIDKISQADSQQMKGKEVVDGSGVSDAVKQWVKDKEENPFIGKPLNETARVGTSPEELKKCEHFNFTL